MVELKYKLVKYESDINVLILYAVREVTEEVESKIHVFDSVGLRSKKLWQWQESQDIPVWSVNPLKRSGVRWLHFEVFSAIHV